MPSTTRSSSSKEQQQQQRSRDRARARARAASLQEPVVRKMEQNQQPQRRRSWAFAFGVLLVVLFVAAVGGILVWAFLPSNAKHNLQTIVNVTNDSSSSSSSGGGGGKKNDNSNNNNNNNTTSFMQCQDAHTDCCNGLDNGFCDLRLNEPLYGLVHNAMSSFEDQFFLLYNQNYKLEDALVAGYRALELDVSRCGDQNQIVFYHGECALGTRDVTEVLANVHAFLKDNPSEIIMLHLQMNNDVVSLDDFYNVMAQVDNGNLVSGLYSHPLNATEWPTLRELIQVNQRLLVFYWNSDDCAPGAGGPGCPPGFHYYYRYGVQTQWDFARLADIQDNNNNDDPDDTSSCALSYMPSYRNGHNFFRVNAFLRIPSSSAAKDVLNQPFFMQERLDACSMQNPIVKNGTVSVQVPAASQEEKFFLPPNFYAVDFWEKGNVMQFIQEYNIKLLQDKAANLLDNTNFGNTVVVDESSPPEEYDATANATDYGATDLDSLISDVTNGDGGRDRRRGQRRQRLRRQL